MTDLNIKHPSLVNGHLVYDHLLGLPFVHGVTDCYELLRKAFKDNFDITLTPYARPDKWWIEDGVDLYMANYHNEGFRLIEINNVSELKIFDLFLICLPDPENMKSTATNHCALYVGNGEVIHHRFGKLSQKVPYRGMLKNFTTAVLRHKDVPDLTKRSEASIDLMDYILPHKRDLLLGALNDKSRK